MTTTKERTMHANSHTVCDWDDPERDAWVEQQKKTFRPCLTEGCTLQLDATMVVCGNGHVEPARGGALAGQDDPEFGGYGNGPGSGAKRSTEPTEAQVNFLTSLIGADVVANVKRDLGTAWTKAKVSELIDAAKNAPKPVTSAKVRTNRYAGKCTKCGGWVEAEQGALTGGPGRWTTEHIGECPAVEEKAAAVEQEDAPEGMHRTADGTIYKVQLAHHGSGRPYAKRLVVHDKGEFSMQHGRPATVEFVYDQGAVRKLSTATLMTLDEAKAFGALYGVCCNCAAILTDEKSIAAGIGPVCGAKEYWA